ncbi:MAG: LacI family DNA-binding transcriptional regulator [Flavobacteriaceae bacterium]|nr:LacI family DNA-binding transcriptional regulator [Flavobacteriaceae bacterium]
MTKNITIHDLARELKLDSSTISRALNDSPRVGIKTKARILEKAKELGYHRNLMASNLRTNKTMTIGVVVPHISRHFFSEAIDGIEQVVAGKGYRVVISQSRDDFKTEKKIVDGLFMNRIDGLLMSASMATTNHEHLNIFINNNIPIVLFDRYFENGALSKVIFEDKKGAFDLTQHMIDGGCKKLYHLSGDLKSQIYEQRYLGYREALKKNNLEFHKTFVRSSNLNKEEAVDIIKAILSEKGQLPDALVCGNDVSALAIMKYLDENTSIKVPDDIMIGGFSNEPASDLIRPGLTTIDQHPFIIGKTAAEMLMNFINDKEKDFQTSNTVVVRSDLIKRGSTKRNK